VNWVNNLICQLAVAVGLETFYLLAQLTTYNLQLTLRFLDR